MDRYQSWYKTPKEDDDKNKKRVGFLIPFFTLLLGLILISWFIVPRQKSKKPPADREFATLNGLLDHGSKTQIYNKLLELQSKPKDSDPILFRNLLRLDRNLEKYKIAIHLIEKFDLNDVEDELASRCLMRSANEATLIAKMEGVQGKVNVNEFAAKVDLLKRHPKPLISKEAYLTKVFMSLTNLAIDQQVSSSEPDLLAHRSALRDALSDLFSQYPHDPWVANNLDQLNGVLANDRVDRQARLELLAMTRDHFATGEADALKQYANKKNRHLMLIEIDMARMHELTTSGFESEFPEMLLLYRKALADSNLVASIANDLIIFPKRFERSGRINDAKALLAICKETLLHRDGEEWQSIQASIERVERRWDLIGKPVSVPSEFGDFWAETLNGSPGIVVFVGQSGKRQDELENQLEKLLKVRLNKLRVAVVSPSSQMEFAVRLEKRFGAGLSLHVSVETLGGLSLRDVFHAEAGNLAMMFQNGKLVRTNLPVSDLFVLLPVQ